MSINLYPTPHFSEVAMPSLQYHLQVNDTNLAVLSPLDGSTLKALNYGQTEVTLLDRSKSNVSTLLIYSMRNIIELNYANM